MMQKNISGWQFWIDRGGTFTDLVACDPAGVLHTHKLLSENPQHYTDAALQGMRDILGLSGDAPLPVESIDCVNMGTTVATNALLERKGDPTVFVTTQGFGEALEIGDQTRPELFARQITRAPRPYQQVIEIGERIGARGEVLIPIDLDEVEAKLISVQKANINSVAVCFVHGYRYRQHELLVAKVASRLGFGHVTLSHQIPLIKFIPRGETTVVDAYLSPLLRRYVDSIARELLGVRLRFMQSNGGLVEAQNFRGKDSILSGPAAGVVGAIRTAEEASGLAGQKRFITFDMGGTSTDVAHYAREYERTFDTFLAGVRLRVPMMHIHTVAAGGGSICRFDGVKFQVGPESAGANPGPCCYRKGGPLCLTDCNVLLGRIWPQHFPTVFGCDANQPIDAQAVKQKFKALAAEVYKVTGEYQSPQEIAEGFVAIAVENMANAIKKISIQQGYDITSYTLCSFGGAGGQHACLIAESLGIKSLFIHPLAGVLSAYGIGLAKRREMSERTVDQPLLSAHSLLPSLLAEEEEKLRFKFKGQGVLAQEVEVTHKIYLRYQGSDSSLGVDFTALETMVDEFEKVHHQRFGLTLPNRDLLVEMVSTEVATEGRQYQKTVEESAFLEAEGTFPSIKEKVDMFLGGRKHSTPVYLRADLNPGHHITGPALVIEEMSTILIPPTWRARVLEQKALLIERLDEGRQKKVFTNVLKAKAPDPVMLEVIGNRFMSIAEQMGAALERTAHSVNIKERLDFSCALFDAQGCLIANAPHIPVHLGSMGESVRAIVRQQGKELRAGDIYALNNPYDGGTHLPDITVVTPVFCRKEKERLFFVGSRGHHADIGGLTPGSMPPRSHHIHQEGVIIDHFLLAQKGQLREKQLRQLLESGPYPVRNFDQNLADLRAQIAANQKGVDEFHKMIDELSWPTVSTYGQYLRTYAAEMVSQIVRSLNDGYFEQVMDGGQRICVEVKVDRQRGCAVIDFEGTSPQLNSNFNAPSAVCKAAVFYVFRTLIEEPIPMNEGVLGPLEIVIPKGCFLSPKYPAAVVAGNVETSQAVVEALYGALGVMAQSQVTMNNFTWGNRHYQYYETICGGSGAGPGFDGQNAVQTHMTNSRLTDPEILESRFPVLLESFCIRRGSGGKGDFRGGDGVIRRVRFLEAMSASILSNSRIVSPRGMAGGEDGKVGRNRVERADGRIEELSAMATTELAMGDVFIIETPGGGGYGRT